MKQLPVIACIALIFIGCNTKKDYDKIFKNPDLFSKTVFQLNGVVMGNNFTPMVASRNYLYASVAAYEVIAGGYPNEYNSLAGQLKGLSSVPVPMKNKQINYEFASILAFCKLGEAVTFPKGSMHVYIDSLKTLATEHGMPEDVFQNSVEYADTVSAVIMAWSKKDNYAQTRTAPRYTILDSPGRWVPTPPSYATAAEPYWNEIRQVVVDSVSEFFPPPPLKFNVTDSTSDYYKEVKLIQNTTNSLTAEQAAIAEFWDDNPFRLNVSGHVMSGTKKFSPGGHWMGIAGIAAKKAGVDFPATVCATAKTAIALFDAFIQCWNIKYKYNTARPITVVNKYFDADWAPHLQTPPFPEYTCGHCYISAAAAEALTSEFGDNFAYSDTTEENFGIDRRSFTSFRNAALETKDSRFYGGIHYHYSVLISSATGKKIGNLVVEKLKMKKN